MTLEKRKNTLYHNLKTIPEIVQDITQSLTELSGLAAFRTDYFSPGLAQINIRIESIDKDLLYTLSFTSEPETLDKHMNSIQKMMDTVQITPIVATSTQSSKSISSNPSLTNLLVQAVLYRMSRKIVIPLILISVFHLLHQT
jgi:hypothetical protein